VRNLDALERKLRVIESNRRPDIRYTEVIRQLMDPVYNGPELVGQKEVGRRARTVK
jgi:hypothetical protein